jgi:hypothetical protein
VIATGDDSLNPHHFVGRAYVLRVPPPEMLPFANGLQASPRVSPLPADDSRKLIAKVVSFRLETPVRFECRLASRIIPPTPLAEV